MENLLLETYWIHRHSTQWKRHFLLKPSMNFLVIFLQRNNQILLLVKNQRTIVWINVSICDRIRYIVKNVDRYAKQGKFVSMEFANVLLGKHFVLPVVLTYNVVFPIVVGVKNPVLQVKLV